MLMSLIARRRQASVSPAQMMPRHSTSDLEAPGFKAAVLKRLGFMGNATQVH